MSDVKWSNIAWSSNMWNPTVNAVTSYNYGTGIFQYTKTLWHDEFQSYVGFLWFACDFDAKWSEGLDYIKPMALVPEYAIKLSTWTSRLGPKFKMEVVGT